MNPSLPRSIDEYVHALRSALADADPALIQDALYDAEDHLRAEAAANPEKSEAELLEHIGRTYGAPDEVAAAYRDTEAKITVALGRPYVLAGHSIGAIYAQAFQALYPDEVAGIAFIEGSTRDNFATSRGQRNLKQTLLMFSLFPTLTRIGVMRVMPWCGERDFPERPAAEIHTACSAVHGWQASRAELKAITALAPLGDLRALPIAVVSAGDHLAADAEWARKQKSLAALSSNSSHEIIAGADHGSVLKDKHDAHRSSLAILSIVQAVRARGRSLSQSLGAQTRGVMLNSRNETALPKQGPTDGADSIPE